MTFGRETDEAGSHEQLDRFLEAGGTLVDTADVYSNRGSEEIIGRGLAKQPPGAPGGGVRGSWGRPRGGAPGGGARTASGSPAATSPTPSTARCGGSASSG